MINLNGNLVAESHSGLGLDNRGLKYGDAVFETMRYSGGKLYFWEDHYFRLMASMRIMRMEIPMDFTPEALLEQIQQTVAAQDASAAYRIRLTVWRGAGGYYRPTSDTVGYMIEVSALDAPFYELSDDPCEVELFKDHYVLSGLLSTIKSNNKAVHVLGSIYAQENDYHNCLLLNEKKMVVEALNGNLFLVSGYKIKTPPLSEGCLNGIMRKQLIALVGSMPDYILEEAAVSPFELQKADELIITNTIEGLRSVSKYRKKEYGNTLAKELIGKLNARARLG